MKGILTLRGSNQTTVKDQGAPSRLGLRRDFRGLGDPYAGGLREMQPEVKRLGM